MDDRLSPRPVPRLLAEHHQSMLLLIFNSCFLHFYSCSDCIKLRYSGGRDGNAMKFIIIQYLGRMIPCLGHS